MTIDLPLIWAGVIAFGIFMYVVMDGFDLGIGILFPFIRDKEERDAMMNTVAPIWDGNETWLVLGGAALFGAFPLAYAVVLSALYLPLMLKLVGLIFRGEPSSSVSRPRPTSVTSGTRRSLVARLRPPSSRGSRWVPSLKASRWSTVPTSVVAWTG